MALLPDARRGLLSEWPSDEQIIAAVDRAADHSAYGWQREQAPGAAFAKQVAEHLDLPISGPGSRWLTKQLRRLAAADMLDQVDVGRGYRDLYAVTVEGDAWLAELARGGTPVELPESPQHRLWREQRASSLRDLPQMRRDARDALAAVEGLLDREEDGAAASGEFDDPGAPVRALARALDALGQAAYWLREAEEPSS